MTNKEKSRVCVCGRALKHSTWGSRNMKRKPFCEGCGLRREDCKCVHLNLSDTPVRIEDLLEE